MKTQSEIKEVREKIDKSLKRLDEAIAQKKEKWIKHNIIESMAHLAVLGYRCGIGHPIKQVNKTEDMLREWSNLRKREKKKRKLFEAKELYSIWAKFYDQEANPAIFVEEKASSKFFGQVRGKDILDLGCGTGRYAIKFTKKGANVSCIDFNDKMLKLAKKKAKKHNLKIDFKNEDITKYKPLKKYDLVISMLVLDHIKNLKRVIEVINKASKIGTKVVISNINPEIIRKNIDIKTGKAELQMTKEASTNQFYHPVKEYIDLFLKEGFVLTKMENLIFDKKYLRFKQFKQFEGIGGDSVVMIMGFEKIR